MEPEQARRLCYSLQDKAYQELKDGIHIRTEKKELETIYHNNSY